MSDDKCVMCGSTNLTSQVERHPLLMSPGVFINAPTEHCQDCGEKEVTFMAFSNLVDWLNTFEGDIPLQFRVGGPHMVGLLRGPRGQTAWVENGVLEFRHPTDMELEEQFRNLKSEDISKIVFSDVIFNLDKEHLLTVLSKIDTDRMAPVDVAMLTSIFLSLHTEKPKDFWARGLQSFSSTWGYSPSRINQLLTNFGLL